MELEVSSTKKFFASKNITLSNDWLESCIQWYRDENPNENFSLETLHLKVYQQWMLLDLRDVEIGILPRNLAQQTKYILNGIFALQIMYIVDVSRPKLWQIQRIRNRNMYNHTTADQDTPNSERVLSVMLTDGVTEIEAIEYRLIRSLNINLSPGTKVQLTGPLMIRKGQIFLEEKNIIVLGGEVEELLVCNAFENVLARSLNLPENPNPNLVEEEVPESRVTQQSQTIIPSSAPRATNASAVQSKITNYTQVNEPRVNNRTNYPQVNEPSRGNNPANEVTLFKETEDEEMKILSEIEMLMEAERDMQEATPKVNAVVEENCLDTEKSIFEDMDFEAHLDMLDEQIMVQNQHKELPKVTIADIQKRTCLRKDKVLIEGKFKKVVRKLTASDNRWILKLLIEDNTAEFEVDMHTDIVTKLLGHTPSTMMTLKGKLLNKKMDAKTKILEIIEHLREVLLNLNCVMEITFSSEDSSPSITDLK